MLSMMLLIPYLVVESVVELLNPYHDVEFAVVDVVVQFMFLVVVVVQCVFLSLLFCNLFFLLLLLRNLFFDRCC